MPNISKDYKFGTDKEISLLETLQNKFGKDLLKSEKKNTRYDFISETVLVELKCRRNNYQKYSTTMIGENKIQYFLNSNKTCYAVFAFTDGIYYCEIEPELLEKCKVKRGGRVDRGCYESANYRFIPISLLQPIETK